MLRCFLKQHVVEPSFCEICSLTGKHAQDIDISTFFVLNLLVQSALSV